MEAMMKSLRTTRAERSLRSRAWSKKMIKTETKKLKNQSLKAKKTVVRSKTA